MYAAKCILLLCCLNLMTDGQRKRLLSATQSATQVRRSEPPVHGSVQWDEWWTYDGISGPSFWGLINPEWSICSKGKYQSPINLEPMKLLFDPNLTPLEIEKGRVDGELTNTGHILKFEISKEFRDSNKVSGGPLAYSYQLHEVHLHFGMKDSTGSEHTIEGYAFPGELQFFGYNSHLFSDFSQAITEPNGLVGIAIVIQLGDLSHPELRLLTDQVEKLKYRGSKVTVRRLSLADFLPDTERLITYEGSTTMPGCYETVTWIIVNKPIYITKQQLHALRKLLQNDAKNLDAPLGDNFRPPQTSHKRLARTNINMKYAEDSDPNCLGKNKTIGYQAKLWNADF